MKKYLPFALLSLSFSILTAQMKPGTTTLNLTVMKSNGQPMADTDVQLMETETEEFYTAKTDAEGKFTLVIDKGHYWQINIGDIVNWGKWQIENRPGMKVTLNKTITYYLDEYHHDTRTWVDRKTIPFKQIKQNIGGVLSATETECVVKLTILKADKTGLPQFPVVLTCLANQTQYLSQTNQSGTAQFLVPINQEYDVDIDVVQDFQFIKIDGTPRNTHSKTITYQPCVFNQYEKNDTIVQNLGVNETSCSNASMMTMTVKKVDGGIWANEPVFVRDVADTTKVMKAKTNGEGIVKFLLVKGHSYRVDFTLQKYAAKVDLKMTRGIGYLSRSVYYRPIYPEMKKTQWPIAFTLPPNQTFVPLKNYVDDKEHPPTEEKALTPPTNLKLVPLTNSEDVKKLLSGQGVEVLDLKILTPNPGAIALAEFHDSLKTNGFEWGMLITSGYWQNAIGPNWTSSATGSWSAHPFEDSLLNALDNSGDFLFDACIVDMTIKTAGSHLSVDYLFGSEEFPEYLDYHDLAAIFLWGEEYGNKPRNIALLPDFVSKISVMTVNHKRNTQWYKASESSPKLQKTWQYDGFTIPLHVERFVHPGGIYHLRFVVADHRDSILDTGFFIKAKSIVCKP